MKYLKKFLLALAIFVVGAAVYNYPKLNIISGYAAKNMASSIYVAKRNAKDVTERDNNVPLIKLAATQLKPKNKSVTASVYGLMKREAVYKAGLGTVLVNDSYTPEQQHQRPARSFTVINSPFPYGHMEGKDTVFDNVDYTQLNKAVESAFEDPELQKTRTVLVVYKDQIIAEEYADNFTKDTPILGWSMTKSILATFYGILQYQKNIDLHAYRPFKRFPESAKFGIDPRENISLDHLLRMQSGLEWDEDYSSISDVTKMLFLDSDMTQTQANKKSIAQPTEVWNYSSGTSNYLSGVLRKELKDYQKYLDFPYSELIDKIGMNSMLLEADMAGNYVGSSYGWASTRDWAKFGLLYLHRGDWNGSQIFAPEWVDYVTQPTEKSEGTYGAHFWLNAGGKYPDVPKDLYSANGYQGQYVFIIPSKELVVVRTGLAEPPNFDVNAFLKGIVTAIR